MWSLTTILGAEWMNDGSRLNLPASSFSPFYLPVFLLLSLAGGWVGRENIHPSSAEVKRLRRFLFLTSSPPHPAPLVLETIYNSWLQE